MARRPLYGRHQRDRNLRDDAIVEPETLFAASRMARAPLDAPDRKHDSRSLSANFRRRNLIRPTTESEAKTAPERTLGCTLPPLRCVETLGEGFRPSVPRVTNGSPLCTADHARTAEFASNGFS
ncbi:hypothetical protein MRX96_015262 [Rhipicephalus microplus]